MGSLALVGPEWPPSLILYLSLSSGYDYRRGPPAPVIFTVFRREISDLYKNREGGRGSCRVPTSCLQPGLVGCQALTFGPPEIRHWVAALENILVGAAKDETSF